MAERYTRRAALLHWAAAALVLALLVSGLAAARGGQAAALRAHLPLGLALLALTLLRLFWAWREARAGLRPAPPAGVPALQRGAARAVQGLLYLVPIGMAVSGVAMVAATGAAPAIFAGAALPDFHEVPPRVAHGVGAALLALLLALHVGAALHHHFVRRDGLLARLRLSAR
jgi:cytochrome b561